MRYVMLFLFLSMAFCVNVFAQDQEYDPEKVYVITQNDGARHIGKILSSDARELLIKTQTIGEVVIPKYQIRSIEEYLGEPVDMEVFATRYFLTTNGLPIEKGDSYIQWTLFGPDVHFGVADNYSVGVMTTWIGIPVVGSIKYSNSLNSKTSFGLGLLAGTLLWDPTSFVFALPYAALTRGDKRSNISLSGGYGYLYAANSDGGQFLFSLGGMRKFSKSGTFIFDSLIFSADNELYTILIPGYRFQTKEKSAWQIGFPGMFISGENRPVGFPTVSWFRKI